MADDHEERFRQHEQIMEGLARMLEAQHGMHQRVEGFMQRQDAMHERLTAAIERLDVTQARMSRNGEIKILIEDFTPIHMRELLDA